MYPYLFGVERLPMYGILMVLGAAVAIVISVLKHSSIPRLDRFLCALFAVIFGLVGAKLFAIVGNLNYVIDGKISFLDLIQNGFVFYGGLIGGVCGALAYIKKFKFGVLEMFDSLAIGLPLAHAIGRLGCFCTGCCYGKPTDSIIGIIFTHPHNISTPVGIKLYPTQLLEAGCLLVIFAVLCILSSKRVRAGILTLVYCLMYAVARFVIEFFRGDVPRVFNNSLTAAQIISILIVLAVGIIVVVYKRKKLNNPLLYTGDAQIVYARNFDALDSYAVDEPKPENT